MIEYFLIIGFIFWAIYKVAIWIFNSLIGILNPQTQDAIRRYTKFALAILFILAILSQLD